MDSGTRMAMSCFTLSWQDSRMPSSFSFRDRWASSVGRMAPPPSVTLHLHMAQEPEPPQADGRKISFPDRADNSVGLPETDSAFSLSLLMVMVWVPWVVTLASTNSSTNTRTMITPEKIDRLIR